MKKELKGFITGVLVTGMLFSAVPAFAGTIYKNIKAALNSVTVQVNGKVSKVENISYKDRTYLQAKDICDLLGKDLSWDPVKRIISITDNTTITPPNDTSTNQNETKPDPNDKTKPAVSSVSATSGTTVEVIFNEQLDKASAENITNYIIAQRYGPKTPLQVTKAQLDSAGTKIILTTSGQQAVTLYNIDLKNVKDMSGNIMDNDTKTFAGMKSDASAAPVIDNSSPFTVKSVTVISGTSVEVVFNHKVEKASAENPANYKINGKYGNKEPVSITKAELDSSGTKVTLTTAATRTILYELKASNMKDTEGNPINTANSTVFVGKEDVSQFTIEAAISTSNTSVEVYFNHKLDKTSAEVASNYVIHAGSENGSTLSVTNAVLDSSQTKVILTTGSMSPGLYKLKVSNVKDIYGNSSNAANIIDFAGTKAS